MTETSRPRGIMAYPMPESVTGPLESYAVVVRDTADGQEVRMVHTEGVAYKVTDDKVWTWNDYNPNCDAYSATELIELTADSDPVDLADWVRTFGARLESNFNQIFAWANNDL